MGIRSHLEYRIEQRLRRIEEQLHDLLLMLESQAQEHQNKEISEQVAIRELFRELEAEQQDHELMLLEQPAANDQSWR